MLPPLSICAMRDSMWRSRLSSSRSDCSSCARFIVSMARSSLGEMPFFRSGAICSSDSPSSFSARMEFSRGNCRML